MKKVLLFGVTSTVGAYTCIYLKERGDDVIAVGHRKDDNGFFALHDMKYYSVDICNQDDFNKLPVAGIFSIIHLAGILPARI